MHSNWGVPEAELAPKAGLVPQAGLVMMRAPGPAEVPAELEELLVVQGLVGLSVPVEGPKEPRELAAE